MTENNLKELFNLAVNDHKPLHRTSFGDTLDSSSYYDSTVDVIGVVILLPNGMIHVGYRGKTVWKNKAVALRSYKEYLSRRFNQKKKDAGVTGMVISNKLSYSDLLAQYLDKVKFIEIRLDDHEKIQVYRQVGSPGLVAAMK